MRLTALDPHWITVGGWVSPELYAIGVRFDCPHCDPSLPAHGPNRKRRVVVFFWPHIDGGGFYGKYGANWGKPHMPEDWTRVAGETFDTLTLTPSVNASEPGGHWHGHITNGEVT